MAELEINKDTPVDAVKDNRAHLVRLARTVFDRMETGAMRAFSQFQKSGDIIRLIEAKRAGVFDYGAHVQQTPTGWAWPSADDALKMLEAAEKGGGAKTAAAAPQQAPAQQQAAEAAPQQQAAAPATRRTATPRQQAPASGQGEAGQQAQAPVGSLDPTVIVGPIREAIDGLRDDLRDAFVKLDGRMVEKVGAVEARVANLGRGLMGLVGVLETVMERQKVIAQYLDEYAELPEPSDEVKKDLLAFAGVPETQPAAPEQPAAVTESGGEAEAPPAEQQATPPAARRAARTTAAQQAPAQQQAAAQQATGGNGADAHEVFNYTKEQLTEIGNKDIAQLRALAEKVGVPNVNAIPFVGVLVARIESFRQKAANA